jgi:hypothetical protein
LDAAMRAVLLAFIALAACSSGDSGGTTGTTPPPVNNNPVPSLSAATPNPILVGSPGVTATVSGSNFISSSVVQWNGQALPTTFVSATQLTAQIPAADFGAAGTGQLTVLTPAPGGGTSGPVSINVALPAGLVVRDAAAGVNWLADADLPATNRFGVPTCSQSVSSGCINPSGSMSNQAAVAWVAAMNAAQYLGHSNWQLPGFPDVDTTCSFTGPHGEPFGWGCSNSGLGHLYYAVLGLKSPNTAVPIQSNAVGPFSNFQPYLYWSGTVPPDGTGRSTFSFNIGFQGSNTVPNYMYVLPMIQGKIPGTPAASGNGLQVNPGGQSVYDPVSDVTWAANANLAATNTFGLPPCTKQGSPNLCVNSDGAMNWDSAVQFIVNMNSGAGYLGQKNWMLPPASAACDATFSCNVPASTDPMEELYYGQLGLTAGTPVVPTPAIVVGGFSHLQPYLYWGCSAQSMQSQCRPTGPVSGFQFSFTFGSGFQDTDLLKNNLYVTVYFVGQ